MIVELEQLDRIFENFVQKMQLGRLIALVLFVVLSMNGKQHQLDLSVVVLLVVLNQLGRMNFVMMIEKLDWHDRFVGSFVGLGQLEHMHAETMVVGEKHQNHMTAGTQIVVLNQQNHMIAGTLVFGKENQD